MMKPVVFYTVGIGKLAGIPEGELKGLLASFTFTLIVKASNGPIKDHTLIARKLINLMAQLKKTIYLSI